MKNLLLALALVLGATSTVNAGDPEYARIKTKLQTLNISIDFQDAEFRDVIDFLREYTDINFVIDQSVFDQFSEEDLRVTIKLREINLKSALKLLLSNKALTARYEHGVLLICTEGNADAPVSVRVYDVRDMLMRIQDFPGPKVELTPPSDAGSIGGAIISLEEPTAIIDEAFLEEMILNNTGSDTWDDNPNCSLTMTENGQLIVSQTATVHRDISNLLARIRQFQ